MAIVLFMWAILNLVLAIMTLNGNGSSGVWLAWSIIIGWVVAIIAGIAKASRS